MEALSLTSTRALRSLMAAQPTTAGKINFAWNLAAGVTLARAATVECTSDGTLHVQAKSAAWGAEIDRARPMILERMTQLLGPEVVRRIKVM
jgi:predicted nucleic acid-binding Zn ribbon protein